MANRMKEDEKNEKIIRGLLKLPANRRCINCNSLGPQYVCTNFWTFICTNCSGTHREFTHRVKSISMAKFTSQEVSSLQEGGNERAKEIYFKEWDPQRHSFPDSSNMDRLRDFIKHVYVDRRYTGERSVDRPPRVKGEDSNENRRLDTYQGGSRSPSYDEKYDRRYGERPASGGRNDDRNFRSTYEERRSPGYDQGDYRRSPGYDQGDYRRSPGYDQGDYRRSPGHIEVVDERRRDNKFGNSNQNQRSEDRNFSDGVPRPEGRSPNHQKDNMSSPPPVRPVRDILGENVPPLRIGEPPKSNASRAADVSAQTQRTTSSSSMGSTDGNSVELKRVNSGSLIDFNADPETPVAATSQQPVSQQNSSPPANGENWASFDFVTQQKPQAASNVNTLESALAQLSATGHTPVSSASTLPNDSDADFFSKPNNVGQQPVTQQNQPSLFPAVDRQAALAFTPPTGVTPSNQSWASSVAPNIQGPMAAPSVQPYQAPIQPSLESSTGVPLQLWASSLAQNVQGPITTPSGQPSQTSVKPSLDNTTGVPSQPHSVEAKPSGRKELPADLFAASYAPAPASVPGWQAGAHLAMGYGMQYPTAPAMPSFPHSSKSTNPFDLSSEPTTIVHAPSFSSMASLQGALPTMADPSALSRSSSFGATPSFQWVAPQQPSHPSAMPPSAYMVQQAPSNMSQLLPGNLLPMGHQGIGAFGAEGPAFGTAGMHQYSQPGTPNSFTPVGGNPFG